VRAVLSRNYFRTVFTEERRDVEKRQGNGVTQIKESAVVNGIRFNKEMF